MTRREREALQRTLATARRRSLEPTDALTSEHWAQAIEELEYRLFAARLVAGR